MQNFLTTLAIIFYALSAVYFYLKFFLKKERTRTLAMLFLILGFITHGLDLVVFALDQHRFPAANLIEAFSPISLLVIAFFIYVVRKEEMDATGVVMIPLAILGILVTAGFRHGEPVSEPVIRSGWIYIHIPLMILSIASLTLTFVLAVLYLLQERQLKSKHPSPYSYRLPSLEACERFSTRSLWFGFLLLTMGILTGIVWSKHLRGVYWSWDYKETWSVVTWAIYAVLIHGRLLSAWRGRKAAYLAIVVFVFMAFTIGISVFFRSYHSF